MTPPLLRAEGVTVRFGGVVAVNAVDMVLEEMELRCLVGPNGAGKSTFFKVMTGELKPSAGRVLFRGRDVTRLMPHQLAGVGIGIKTQIANVFNGLTVRENVFLGAIRRNTPRSARRTAEAALERTRLTGFANRIVGELAHGQRQWTEIAMVLAQEPELLVLDEPVAGMTKDEVIRTAELIRDLNRERAVIVVEHDMEFIRMIARTVTVFNQGSVLAEGPVDEVLADPVVRDVYLGKQAA